MKKRPYLVFLSYLFIVILFLLQTPSALAFKAYTKFDAAVYVEDENILPEDGFILSSGNMMVPISMMRHLGIKVEWEPKYKVIILSDDKLILGMTLDKRRAYSSKNGFVQLPAFPLMVSGVIMLPLRYIAESFGNYVIWDENARSVIITKDKVRYKAYKAALEKTFKNISRGEIQKKKVVVIDPGHGGTEIGAYYYGVTEKELNLEIALKLERLLKRKGITVYMTRTYDKTVSLDDRANFANQVNADLFISIHNNASTNSSYSGTMTLYYPTARDTKGRLNGRKLAGIIQEELVKKLKTKDLGKIARPHLVVLRKTAMPAIIAEISFMSNYRELNLLKQDWYQNNTAAALCEGILKALEQQ